ncbi:MAG: hypothetical protein MI723_17380, partial [Caulobacterales bacterium]|nr:hypothetical protein [Caulobacterales bacterium]
EGRIVVTQDRDFGDRLIRKAVPAAGAFLLRTDDLARGLDAISKDRDRCRGALVIVTDAAVRVRTLPNQDDDVS